MSFSDDTFWENFDFYTFNNHTFEKMYKVNARHVLHTYNTKKILHWESVPIPYGAPFKYLFTYCHSYGFYWFVRIIVDINFNREFLPMKKCFFIQGTFQKNFSFTRKKSFVSFCGGRSLLFIRSWILRLKIKINIILDF